MKKPMYVLGVAGLALGVPAPASVVTTVLDNPVFLNPAGTETSTAEVYRFDFNSDETWDLTIVGHGSGLEAYLIQPARITIRPSPPPNIGGWVDALPFGTEIGMDLGGSGTWYVGGILSAPDIEGEWGETKVSMNIFGSTGYGGLGSKQGAIGLEFDIDGQVHYGYLHVDFRPEVTGMTPGQGGLWGYVYGWAYETEPGVPIVAQPVPEPSVGGLLMVGLAGWWFGRKCGIKQG